LIVESGDMKNNTPQLSTLNSSLSKYATDVRRTKGRLVYEEPSGSRTEFQRDKDRVIHSNAFRRMRNKTQVFIESEGDYYRTRLTHSMEVSQIAHSIAKALVLDTELADTVALAHDLGHTCFGHAGEDALAEAMRPYGGFNHNEQTFRILTKLEKRYARFDGLNLTWEALEGIVKHNGAIKDIDSMPYVKEFCSKWDLEVGTFSGLEAQIAALSDDIAYNTHDADDGHHAGFFSLEELRELPVFNKSIDKNRALYPEISPVRVAYEVVRDAIGVMADDVIATTKRNIEIYKPLCAEDVRNAPIMLAAFSEEMADNIKQIKKFLFNRMYKKESVYEKMEKAKGIVSDLFEFYMNEFKMLPTDMSDEDITSESIRARLIADFIAGMTDRYAIKLHEKLGIGNS